VTAFDELRFPGSDGLPLAGRLYGSLNTEVLPLVCLPGISRNARDFHALAEILARHPAGPPLVAFDYRGRGRSAWATDAATYTVAVEAADVLTGLAHLGITRALFVGTSRGALLLHVLAITRPSMLAGAVLNDAGPRLEAEGLRAIRVQLGRGGPFADWPSAAAHLARLHGPAFPALAAEDFARMAEAMFVETADGFVPDHDPRLAEQLSLLDLDQPLPELWLPSAPWLRCPSW
jgi:pimeloyl-ACP methyl ester carboxylesterase